LAKSAGAVVCCTLDIPRCPGHFEFGWEIYSPVCVCFVPKLTLCSWRASRRWSRGHLKDSDARDTSRRRYYSDTLSLAALFLAMRRAALVTVQVLRCSFAQNKTCARIRQRLPWKVLRSRGSVLGLSRGFHHMPPAPPTFASHHIPIARRSQRAKGVGAQLAGRCLEGHK
jgi:hypothetical protein